MSVQVKDHRAKFIMFKRILQHSELSGFSHGPLLLSKRFYKAWNVVEFSLEMQQILSQLMIEFETISRTLITIGLT